MLDAALGMMTPMVLNAIHRGETDQRIGNVQTARPGYAVYDCNDESIMVGAYNILQHRSLFEALGLDDLMVDPDHQNFDWLRDNDDELRTRMQHCFETQSAEYWENRLNNHHVPAARFRDLYGMLQQEQLQRAAESQHQRLDDSPMTTPVAAFKYASDGSKFNDYCARHGEDTDAVLVELGISVQRHSELRKAGII